MSKDMKLKVSPRTVQQETANTLRQAIFSGHFEPGSRLVESQLCTQLGISRPSLREALRSLAAERLIDLVPNRGPFIPVLTWQEVTAIYEVRELLEVEAIGRCSQQIPDAQLAALETSLEAFEAAASSDDSLAQITTTEEFYSIILANCGNSVLEELHRGLVARISLFRSRSMSLKGRATSSAAEMRAIYEAIAAGDEVAARNASRIHILNAMAAARMATQSSS